LGVLGPNGQINTLGIGNGWGGNLQSQNNAQAHHLRQLYEAYRICEAGFGPDCNKYSGTVSVRLEILGNAAGNTAFQNATLRIGAIATNQYNNNFFQWNWGQPAVSQNLYPLSGILQLANINGTASSGYVFQSRGHGVNPLAGGFAYNPYGPPLPGAAGHVVQLEVQTVDLNAASFPVILKVNGNTAAVGTIIRGY